MTSSENYLQHKKQTVTNLVHAYNADSERHMGIGEFQIDEKNLDLEKTFCTPSMCGSCDSNCCLAFPCVFSPDDFLDFSDLDYMRSILNTGIIAISQSKDKKLLVLRPRGIADQEYIVSLSINRYEADGYNPCVCYSYEEGTCLLPTEFRPSEGLLYYPIEVGRHRVMYGERDYEADYEPYQEVLQTLYQEYRFKEALLDLDENRVKENVAKLTKCMSKSL